MWSWPRPTVGWDGTVGISLGRCEVPKRGRERRRLERVQNRLAVAGNGCYLAGSVLYLVEAPASAAWLFVIGSLAALLATVIPQLVRLWIQPREGDGPGLPGASQARRFADSVARPRYRVRGRSVESALVPSI